jgi:hypothetical protein
MSFLDPGGPSQASLSERQRDCVRAALWTCVTAGPATALAAVLDTAIGESNIAWVVKADEACFPPALARALLGCAAVVTYNVAERPFLVAAAGSNPEQLISGECLLIETNGPAPIRYRLDGVWYEEPVSDVFNLRATGAGDAFAGGLVGHLASHPDEGLKAIRAGKQAVVSALTPHSRNRPA